MTIMQPPHTRMVPGNEADAYWATYRKLMSQFGLPSQNAIHVADLIYAQVREEAEETLGIGFCTPSYVLLWSIARAGKYVDMMDEQAVKEFMDSDELLKVRLPEIPDIQLES